MTTLKITIENTEFAQTLAGFLRSLKQVKEVEIEKPATSLTEADWIKPGRKATIKEIEELAMLMEKEETYGSMTSRQLKQEMKKWVAKASK